jgi:hypothetical protein
MTTNSQITAETKITVRIERDVQFTTLGSFLADNGDDADFDVAGIRDALAAGRRYVGGGGAAPEWSVEITDGRSLTDVLASHGLGHRRDSKSGNDGRRVIFVEATGRELGRFDAHEAWAQMPSIRAITPTA